MKIRRTLLWIPGNNPAMMANAPILKADIVCLDNEDAVQVNDKDAARILIRNYLKNSYGKRKVEIGTRINDVTTPYWQDDIKTLVPGRPDTLVIPKVEHSSDIDMVDELTRKIERENNIPEGSTKFMAIIETALGVELAFEIATNKSGRLEGLMMGGEDLVTSLGGIRTEGSQEIDYARKRCVIAAKAAGLGIMDTVYTSTENIEGLIEDTRYDRQLGFTGRAAITPRQVPYINEIFSPSKEEIAYAREVLSVYEEGRKKGTGAVTLHGKMIDGPMVVRANQILESARRIEGGND